MIEPALPVTEQERLRALYALQLLNSPREERFDRITRIAAKLLDMPIAIITLVDAERQWFKSTYGLAVQETPRSISFCGHTILGDSTFIVPNALLDQRFFDNPLVVGGPEIRFYAGRSIQTEDGNKMGTLCVIDRKPRTLTEAEIELLTDLAMLAQNELTAIRLQEALDHIAKSDLALRQERQILDAFMNHSPAIAFIKDSESRSIFMNRRGEELFKVSDAELRGKRDDQWLPPEIGRVIMENDRKVLASNQVSEFIEAVPMADGRTHQWLVFKFPIERESGEKLLGGVGIEITARLAAESALNELSTLQRAILDSANFAIVSADTDGTIRTFNSTVQNWLGYSEEEVVGKAAITLLHDPGEIEKRAAAQSKLPGTQIAPGVEALVCEARAGGAHESEWTYVRKDGSTFPVMLSVTAIRDSSGTITGFMAVARDITAQKKHEAAMILAKEEAEHANRAKSQFLANMSHEVRTPLNGILGVNGMLLESTLSSEQKHLAETVQFSAESLLSIVNDILEFSKIEAGHLNLELEDFPVTELISGVVDLHSARAQKKGVLIESSIDPRIPKLVHGDPGRLRQVLNNLVGNALKFSEHGAIRIAVEPLNEDFLRFSITDEGIGIAPEAQAHIFEAFVQADDSITSHYGGTGLGLSICRQLAGLMGGEIGLESVPGNGATFWFTIRFRAASQMPLPPEPVEEFDEMSIRLAGRPLRILLAEDNRVNRMVAIHQLQAIGCQVESVENGRAALEILERESFDIIFMDCQMPVMDGYSATIEIRRREEASSNHTWIIAVTANAMDGERERCLEVGMDDYLSKPFRRAELVKVIRRIVAQIAPVTKMNSSSVGSEEIAQFKEFGHEMLVSVAEAYQRESRLILLHLEESLATGNLGQLTAGCHKLRGSSAYFGAHRLEELCLNLEQSSGTANRRMAGKLVAAIKQETEVVIAALDAECTASLAEFL
ncbi:MAG: ATPase [Chthoniobacteraceae bacterium]|nr:ATPase [Chthoniobacteraceae bacterium]